MKLNHSLKPVNLVWWKLGLRTLCGIDCWLGINTTTNWNICDWLRALRSNHRTVIILALAWVTGSSNWSQSNSLRLSCTDESLFELCKMTETMLLPWTCPLAHAPQRSSSVVIVDLTWMAFRLVQWWRFLKRPRVYLESSSESGRYVIVLLRFRCSLGNLGTLEPWQKKLRSWKS